MSFESTALILAWIAIALLAFAMSGLLRHVHLLASRGDVVANPSGPAIGSHAPAIEDGVAPGPAIYLFMDNECATCRELLSFVPQLSGNDNGTRLRLVFANEAGRGESLSVPFFEQKAALFERFSIPATPFAVAVSADGRIAQAEPIGSTEMFERFVHVARGGSDARD